MGILVGMDEAGYGPNLGPLAVAATAWEVADNACVERAKSRNGRRPANNRPGKHLAVLASRNGSGDGTIAVLPRTKAGTARKRRFADEIDLYSLLRNIVAKSGSERRVPIADSKVLYNPATGLRQLERGLHAVLRTMGQHLSCWSQIVQYCGADPDGCHCRVCWPEGFDCSLPIHAEPDELSRLGIRFGRACQAVGVRPLFIRARLVFPEQFNDLVAHLGNKAAALSHITVGLLREVTDAIRTDGAQPSARSPSPIYAVCDKHGGRNFYTAFLQHHFSEHWIAPVFESHAESHYQWGQPEERVRVTFRVNGETFLPTALASMTAKYLRELVMRAFNEFWCARVPDLRPTAGYYGDSRRFKKAIADKQRELGIDDHLIWRNR
jgi:hypothetical protein